MNPLECAVLGADDHLPTLPETVFTELGFVQTSAECVGFTVAGMHPSNPIVLDAQQGWIRGRPWGQRPMRSAAVLMAVYWCPQQLSWQLILTCRSATMKEHAGEISFAGGRCEPTDTSVAHTAVREAQEEIGLNPAHVQVLGQWMPYTTVSNYEVVPVLARVQADAALACLACGHGGEVSQVFAVPLVHVLNPCMHQWRSYVYQGTQRRFVSMPYTDVSGERMIWGATAAMLRNVYLALAWHTQAAQMTEAAHKYGWRNEY